MMRKLIAATVLAVLMSLFVVPFAAAQAQTSPCEPGEYYFRFEYNFGTGGDLADRVDEGCWPRADVYQTQFPGLIATMLHVSCSDQFVGGVGQDSDLGDPNRRVVAWYVLTKNGKACGVGNPIPIGGLAGAGLLTIAVGVVAFTQLRRRNDDPLDS
jgi:hypothetical protein